MTEQLALPLDAAPFGDPVLNTAAVQALRALLAHSQQCVKGCAQEPPLRCAQGWRLRAAERAAQQDWRATIEPARLEAVRDRVAVWVELQRAAGEDWFRR